MEYLIGTRDSATSVFADTTTVLPCDGTVHSADLSFGELNWHDVFVRADRKTDWHLLVTVEPPPIATARDETGWKLSTDAGPRYNFSDSTESLVGGAGEASATIRIVVTCLGGTDITVTVNSNSVATEPPLQSYTVPCNAAAPTTVTETVELPNGSYDVEIGPHGRMWYATTVQREIAASHAP
jgi:hypothetical protein